MQEQKYFICASFEHIAYNYQNRKNIKREEIGKPKNQPLNNKFAVLSSRIIQIKFPTREKIKNH